MENKFLPIVSVIAAGFASLCCIGPLVAVGVGLGAFGAATFFEGVRPYLLFATASFLVAAFYLTYRKKPAEKCEEGVCAVDPKRSQKLALWIATGVVIPLAAFPYYSDVFGGQAESNSGNQGMALSAKPGTADGTPVAFEVEGMTCAGCAAGIQATLARRAGVEGIEVSYDEKTARVAYDRSQITEQQLVSAFEELGYTVARKKGGRNIELKRGQP